MKPPSPSEVSLYFAFISLAVRAMAEMVVLARSTRRSSGISSLAMQYAVDDLTAP